MTIFTIGFTKKSARTFFDLIKNNQIKTVIDIRLNNSSQLSGFSKGRDLEYFLAEICHSDYFYEAIFAPSKALMDGIKSKKISLGQYEADYRQLISERNALSYFEKQFPKMENICLLCSEETPELCHRRVLAEMLSEKFPQVTIIHL